MGTNLGTKRVQKRNWCRWTLGGMSSHGLWFRIGPNALCLWSDVSRGHGRLHDLCPLSEIVGLSIETGTCDGCEIEVGETTNCYKQVKPVCFSVAVTCQFVPLPPASIQLSPQFT